MCCPICEIYPKFDISLHDYKDEDEKEKNPGKGKRVEIALIPDAGKGWGA